MKLEDFGYNDKLEKLRIESKLSDFEIGRVIADENYLKWNGKKRILNQQLKRDEKRIKSLGK